MKFIRMSVPLLLAFFATTFVAGTSSANSGAFSYLSTQSSVHLDSPICVFVEDNRAIEEREGDPSGFWLYTIDKPDRTGAAIGLGIDVCKLMEDRGVTTIARVALPGEVAPDSCVVINISLESWFGRVRSFDTMTEKLVGALSSSPTYAEGHCRFSSTVITSGKTQEIGVSEGTIEIPVSRNATVSEEGVKASALAADQALAQFFQAFEKMFAW